MDLNSNGLRQRKGITKIVEDLDIFEKVVENVKEEQKASSGLISFICFALIFFLFSTETYSFLFTTNYEYKVGVDTEMDEMPTLDIDMIVATPCGSLQVVSSTDQYANFFGGLQQSIQKNPTRFEFTDEEQMYWTVLRHAHAQFNSQGIRAIEQLEYIDDDVESNLEHLAEEKQKVEAANIMAERKKKKKEGRGGHAGGQVMFMIGNGMGMFQIVADNGAGDGAEEGTACRVHGKFKVRKGSEEKIVISIQNPMQLFDHFGASTGNISHRIEKFNFGPRIPGLVTPLSGAEHISIGGQDIYRYFIKIVPTKIYGYFSYTMAYQYSVTFLTKNLTEGEHSHGGILFEYEFTANVIEVRKTSTTILSYLIRICSILGGVYATSTIINNFVQFFLSFLYHTETKLANVQPLRSLSTESETHLIMDANIRVH